ncbi:hypothetical protein ACLOJK_014609 [Asimina triloba]
MLSPTVWKEGDTIVVGWRRRYQNRGARWWLEKKAACGEYEQLRLAGSEEEALGDKEALMECIYERAARGGQCAWLASSESQPRSMFGGGCVSIVHKSSLGALIGVGDNPCSG